MNKNKDKNMNVKDNTPQMNGIIFERKVHDYLKSTNFNILNETEIRNKYGSNVSGIDHIIFNDNYIICIQDKYMSSKPCVYQINHFIYCVFEISYIEKKKCIGLYLSNLAPTRVAQKSFESMNQKYDFVIFKSIHNSIDILIDSLLEYLYTLNIFIYDEDGSCIMRNNC
jgi:hypothetical protein